MHIMASCKKKGKEARNYATYEILKKKTTPQYNYIITVFTVKATANTKILSFTSKDCEEMNNLIAHFVRNRQVLLL